VLAPEIFKEIRCLEGEKINFEESLSIWKNYKEMEKAGGADGGRGGEFFFFSHDNHIIVKTLNSEEREVFLNMLGDYYKYLKNHPDSLISKIFGLYEIKGKEHSEPFTIVMMKNVLAGVDRQHISRVYDMKGSSVDREVLKKGGMPGAVMKDTDFLKRERYVKVPGLLGQRVIKALREDAEFFCKKGIMDYSLLIFVVDMNKKSLEFVDRQLIDSEASVERKRTRMQSCDFLIGKVVDEEACKQVKGLKILRAMNDQGVPEGELYYHIGIIDYFQLYNTQKQLERFFKRLMKLSPKLDVSSQPPDVYAERFANFAKTIFEPAKTF
jgi:hypothetical protein